MAKARGAYAQLVIDAGQRDPGYRRLIGYPLPAPNNLTGKILWIKKFKNLIYRPAKKQVDEIETVWKEE